MEKIKETKKCILKKKDMPLLQKEMNKTGLLFLGLCLMILTFGFTGDIIGLTKYDSFFGIAYIVFCVVAIIILALIDRKSTFNFQSPLNNKMTPLSFIKYFSCMITLMTLFTIPTIIIEMILGAFGFSILEVASANEASSNIADMLYASLIGPITEELMFRGFVLKRLQKYSPIIAIATSAVMFGVYHGAFGQMFGMIGVGLLLGYVSYKYSLKWAIVIHISYNFIFGELFGRISDAIAIDGKEYVLPIINQTPFMACIMSLCAIGVVFFGIMITKGKFPFEEYKIRFGRLFAPYKNIGMILFIILNIVTACCLIEKI